MSHPSAPQRPSRARRGGFRLGRIYSVASLVGLVLVTACVVYLYRSHALRQLLEHEERSNTVLTAAFGPAVWAEFRAFLGGPAGRTPQDLVGDPRLAALHDALAARMRGLPVVKVKFFDRDGLTVYSSDPRQVGEDKRGNDGVRRALSGEVVSQLTHRDRFDAFEGEISDRTLISSYVPVRIGGPDAPIEGVVEVYSDVTAMDAQSAAAQMKIAVTAMLLLGMLYLFLYLVVHKSERIILAQERERDEREAQSIHQALHDALTGLPNRACLSQQLGAELAQAAHDGRRSALMFVDLDRFKTVNDSLGHHAGDALLKAVCARIRAVLGPRDRLYRVGGDEFTVLLPDVADEAAAAAVARAILGALEPAVPLDGVALNVGASIGIALHPDDGRSAEQLLRCADAAMYVAKAAGRGTFAAYRVEMGERAERRLRVELAMRKALRCGEFVLHYQPRLDAHTRETVAFEALLRWNSPDDGIVAPGAFIDVLEESGLIGEVGEWVMRSACAQANTWTANAACAPCVSVNVGTQQFQSPGFVDLVVEILRDSGLPADRLELELTESQLMQDPARAQAVVGALRALGVRVSIDDFGTGYSSLSYLSFLAVDFIKVDRSIVAGVDGNARERAVLQAIVDVAAALDIRIVAEGVETASQARFFERLPGAEMQGFLFSRPLPPEAIGDWLRGTADGMTAAGRSGSGTGRPAPDAAQRASATDRMLTAS